MFKMFLLRPVALLFEKTSNIILRKSSEFYFSSSDRIYSDPDIDFLSESLDTWAFLFTQPPYIPYHLLMYSSMLIVVGHKLPLIESRNQ